MDLSFEDVIEAYYSCRKNKRTTYSSLEFEMNLERNLYELYKDLRDGEYSISPSICFVVKQPKVREVWAAQFRDRVVHHIIYNKLSPYWNRRFEADSCACIPGRGTMYGAIRLESHIRSSTENWSKEAFYLKCDLANFFTSIDKNILWEYLNPTIREEWVKELCYKVLFNFPIENGIYLSPKEEYALVEPRKRLGHFGRNKGLPIGNLTSQFFANVLMDILDKFVKHHLRVKHYIRYVDDCIVISRDKDFLRHCFQEMSRKIEDIGMKFNNKKCFIHSVYRGVSFVGQTIYPHRRVPLRNTELKCFDKVTEENLHCYLSFFRQAGKSYNVCNRIIKHIGETK